MRWPVMKLLLVSPPSALLQTATSGLNHWHICVGQLPPGPRRGSPTVESPATKIVGTVSSFTISIALTHGRVPLNSMVSFSSQQRASASPARNMWTIDPQGALGGGG